MFLSGIITKQLIKIFGESDAIKKVGNVLGWLILYATVFFIAFGLGYCSGNSNIPKNIQKLQEKHEKALDKKQKEIDTQEAELNRFKLDLAEAKGEVKVLRKNLADAREATNQARKETDDALEKVEKIEKEVKKDVSMEEFRRLRCRALGKGCN